MKFVRFAFKISEILFGPDFAHKLKRNNFLLKFLYNDKPPVNLIKIPSNIRYKINLENSFWKKYIGQ